MDHAQTWRRVFSKMTSLQHESDDDALSFQRLSNWQDTCRSTCESEADRSQRTRRDSQFQNTHPYTRLEKQTELVAVATKDRTINPDLERGMPRAHMATRSKSWGQPLGLHLETQGGCSSHRRRCNARAMKSSEVLCARCKQFYM